MKWEIGFKRSYLAKNFFAALSLFLFLAAPSSVSSSGESLGERVKDRSTSFYRDFFDSVIYDSLAGFLRFDELSDKISFAKKRALDVNVFDEVPDSGFFVNRHGRTKLALDLLKKGPAEGSGPNPGSGWKVLKGKGEGVSAGLLIEDDQGVKYLLKFDPMSNPEMATSAEIISHKFFHAMGYHVPEYYLVDFKPDILSVDPKATYYDGNGFKKPLTGEALWELLDRVPKRKGGLIRASASKFLTHTKGYMDFDGRRTSDPEDTISHEDRRSIRALRVFGSWLNHYDLRKGNTLDVIETKDGKEYLKHYLIDFGSTLGSAADDPKAPVAGHEHIVDWYKIGGAVSTFKVVEKPWEKRWDDQNRTIAYPELGYFDNLQFDPGKWKTQLHYEAFKALTKGDAFWAAKIIMRFSDEEIRSVVETASYASPEHAKFLTDTLIARRDTIGRYWFSRVTPLDDIRLFHVGGNQFEISFRDLSVEYGFADQGASGYRYRLKTVKRGSRLGAALKAGDLSGSPLVFEVPELETLERVLIRIQVKRESKAKWSEPPLLIELARSESKPLELAQIDHGA